MIIAPGYIGIDISKDYLDIFDGTAHRIANTPEAIAAYVGELADTQLVLFEATGRYDRQLQQMLHQANHATQHRSEAALLLTRAGASPGWLDFLVFLDERAATA